MSDATLIANISSTRTYTFSDDYELVLILTSNVGTGYKPTYDGITYDYLKGNNGNCVFLHDVKANTSVTFQSGINAGLYAYSII